MPRGIIPPNHQILPLPMANPGSMGLNLQKQNQVLDPSWSIEALNAVIDGQGRCAARGGFTTVSTGTAAPGAVRSIFEWIKPDGTYVPIFAADGSLSNDPINPGNNNLAGAGVVVTSGLYHFMNFNGKVIGTRPNAVGLIKMDSSTNVFNINSATGLTATLSGIATAAYGRLWVVNADLQTIQWSALLDETNFSTGDSGSLNMAKVWPLGGDRITALEAYNGTLVVFGTRQIIFYGSTNPSVLGLDVTTLAVTDALEGTGCISQRTVAHVGETDLIFLSQIGIQSLQRLLIQRSRPTTNLSKNIRDTLLGQLVFEDLTKISGWYSPTNGFYALSLPVSGYTWIADQKRLFQDEDGDTCARMTRWGKTVTAGFELYNRTMYMADSAAVGKVAKYQQGGDDSNTFLFTLTIPWLDLGDQVAQHLKSLKHVGAIVYAQQSQTLNFSWFTDFNQSASGSFTTSTVLGSLAQWGVAQWGIDQWSGGLLINAVGVPGTSTGRYFSVSLSTQTTSYFAVQQFSLTTKILRITQ